MKALFRARVHFTSMTKQLVPFGLFFLLEENGSDFLAFCAYLEENETISATFLVVSMCHYTLYCMACLFYHFRVPYRDKIYTVFLVVVSVNHLYDKHWYCKCTWLY